MFIPFDNNTKSRKAYGSVVYHIVNGGREKKKPEEIWIHGVGFVKTKDLTKRQLRLHVSK